MALTATEKPRAKTVAMKALKITRSIFNLNTAWPSSATGAVSFASSEAQERHR
jgi:hypothetical protein